MPIHFILIHNRQGKTRLSKWYEPCSQEERRKIKGEVHQLVGTRDQKFQSNFVAFRDRQIVYRRYAGLFFSVCIDAEDNELYHLEVIHLFVETLDTFFGSVSELDVMFNFDKVHAALDEVFLCGEVQETSRKVVLARLEEMETLV